MVKSCPKNVHAVLEAQIMLNPTLQFAELALDNVIAGNALEIYNSRFAVVEAAPSQAGIDVAALIQQAVSQDPEGRSLSAETLSKLMQAPADYQEFGI